MKVPQAKPPRSNVVALPLAKPDDRFLAMAAARMHQEGRLVEPTPAQDNFAVPKIDLPR